MSELREAAERIIGHMGAFDDELMLARHVIATVQPDDDEPLTEAWLLSVGFEKADGTIAFRFGELIEITPSLRRWYVGEWLERIPKCLVPKTRGQLRRLFESLEIEMQK